MHLLLDHLSEPDRLSFPVIMQSKEALGALWVKSKDGASIVNDPTSHVKALTKDVELQSPTPASILRLLGQVIGPCASIGTAQRR